MDHVPFPPYASVCRARRKWVVRSLVFAVLVAAAGAGMLYQRYTNPAAIRRQVIEKLGKDFPGCRVALESARLRLLGGIAITDLRLSRDDDPDDGEFLYVPSGILYHDKEQLLDGRMVIRKVELFRPRVRVVRGPDGRWNLAGVLAPSEPNEPMPTLVFHQGTIVFEDRQAAPEAPPVELKEVNVTLVNDPLPTITFEVSATSDLVGPLRLKGTRDRPTDATNLVAAAPAVPVGPALVQLVAAYCPEAAAHARQLHALARLEATLDYRPQSAESLNYDLRANLSQGEFSHAELPLPLDHLEASLRCTNGQIPLATVSARSGPARLDVTAKDIDPHGSRDSMAGWVRELECHIRNLPVTEALFKPLPDYLQEIGQDYQPRGPADIDFTFVKCLKKDGLHWEKHCLFRGADMQACYAGFPYPVEHVRGTIDAALNSEHDDVIAIALEGRAAGQPFKAEGKVLGDRPCGVLLDVWGKNLPLDETIVKALPDRYQDLARSFHATGKADFHAIVRRPLHGKHFANRFVVHFHDATTCYDVFPYPLENVTGDLDIQPDGWEFRGFRGSHKGGTFQTWGHTVPTESGDRLEINLKGSDIVLDPELAEALKPEPELYHAWHIFSPAGRINFEGKVERPPGSKPDVDLTVYPKDGRIRPDFFPLALHDMQGRLHYAHRWVELDNLRARHGGSRLSLERGTIYLKPGGGVWAELVGVRGRPLVPDADFVRALPPTLQKACAALQVRDPVTLNTQLVIDSTGEPGAMPVVYWDGWAGLRDVSVFTGLRLEHVNGQVACRGRHNGRQLDGAAGNFILKRATLFGNNVLEDVRGPFEVAADNPEVLKLPGVFARYCGGEVYGPLRVEFGPDLRYEMKLTASQVQLEEFARMNNLGPDAQLRGLASANLYLSGQGGDLNNLRGSGNVAVPEGKMYNLPLLLDLLKVVGLRPPDRTAFEEAAASFEITGPRVHVEHIDLIGNAISLRGTGDLNLDGTDIDLGFNVDWARLPQMLPASMRGVPHAISDQLLRIHMTGQLGDVHFSKEPVPGLTAPFRRLFDEWRGAGEERPPGQAASPAESAPVLRFASPGP
jgi:hypothetical protein